MLRAADLALVEVDDVVEDDGLEEGGRLGRRPAGVERRLDTRNHVRRGQHNVEQVQYHHLQRCIGWLHSLSGASGSQGIGNESK